MNRYMYVKDMIKIINANKKLFLERIAPIPKNFEYFLSEDMPRMICKAYGGEEEKVVLKNIFADDKQNSKYFTIFVEFEDDFPQEIPQCYAIAVAIGPEDDIRLFTYEKGEDYMNKTPQYYVGEFDAEGKHYNYGTTNGVKQVYEFGAIVMEQLNKK